MVTFGWPIILMLNAILIVLMAILVLWKITKDKSAGYPIQDERSSKIQGKAALGTYYISFVFMISFLVWTIIGKEFLILPELEAGWTVIAIMLVSGISFALLSWHYAKKGEF